MRRLFIATKIELSPGIRSLHQSLQFDLRYDNIVWVRENVRHLTLRFLGATPEPQIKLLKKLLAEVCSQSAPFTLHLDKLGIFGSRYAPKVIWAGFEDFTPFRQLFDSLENALQEAGFAPNAGNFVPHVTLGRIKKIQDKARFRKIIEKHKIPFTQDLFIKDMTLYQSILKSEGPEYTALLTCPLSRTK